ncbi:uncharacterized protein LOC123897255 isoform X2 [Trifolium pratense]|nr:uncharacterized protein LOC123897255 isoform X2 [Trifolium pratense]XP_045803790.1 uncharacterized protein LOC123897255 isoform X2 [Trifolium pratense]
MGRKALADAMKLMAKAMAQDAASRTAEREAQEHRRGGEDELRLQRFMNNKPPIFDGGYDPEGALKWIEGVERIFNAMRCQDVHKVTLGSYVLHEEADYWWKNASQRLGAGGAVITWDRFKREFLIKYFPADERNRKVVEFMELKQGNMSVSEYAAKFEELCRFAPHYNTVEAEEDKCVKFENGLRPDIKQLIGFNEIRDFPTLVNKSRICDKDGKAKANYLKAVNDKKGKDYVKGKPYDKKGKKSDEGGSSGKGKGNGNCFKCGLPGHRFFECPRKDDKCLKCGKIDHKTEECKKPVVCFNCKEEGHKSHVCKKPRVAGGKVFALDGGDVEADNLIRDSQVDDSSAQE